MKCPWELLLFCVHMVMVSTSFSLRVYGQGEMSNVLWQCWLCIKTCLNSCTAIIQNPSPQKFSMFSEFSCFFGLESECFLPLFRLIKKTKKPAYFFALLLSSFHVFLQQQRRGRPRSLQCAAPGIPAGPSKEMLWGLGAAQSTRHIPSSSSSEWKSWSGFSV